jgi:hypothetical protein
VARDVEAEMMGVAEDVLCDSEESESWNGMGGRYLYICRPVSRPFGSFPTLDWLSTPMHPGKEYWLIGREWIGENVLSTILKVQVQKIQVRPKLKMRI